MSGLWRQASAGAVGGALSAVGVLTSTLLLGWITGPPTDNADPIGLGALLVVGAGMLGVVAGGFGAIVGVAFELVRRRQDDRQWNLQAGFMVALLVFYAALSLLAGTIDFDRSEVPVLLAAPLFPVAWNPWLAAPLWAWIGSLPMRERAKPQDS